MRGFSTDRDSPAETARSFLVDESGATAIEYAMIASLLSIAIATAVLGFSGGTGSMFDEAFGKLRTALLNAG